MFSAQDHGICDADWATAKPAATDFRIWCREVLKPAAECCWYAVKLPEPRSLVRK